MGGPGRAGGQPNLSCARGPRPRFVRCADIVKKPGTLDLDSLFFGRLYALYSGYIAVYEWVRCQGRGQS